MRRVAHCCGYFTLLVSASTPVNPDGWAPVDARGVSRYSALGLFSSSKQLCAVQGSIRKDPRNPLFIQDQPWETRIDNGYPNVVYDPDYYPAPWRLWYGNIGGGTQQLLYANSSDGLAWMKPDLGRYNLSENWKSDPSIAKYGKHNNIIMTGGGLGIYRDLHEKDPALRYKISGGAPAGCYNDDGSKDCLIGTAGSPDGVSDWTDARALGFPNPWRPDCHTNIIYDEPLGKYLLTTRNYELPQGREISIARTGRSDIFKKNGTYTLMYNGEYPNTMVDRPCFVPSSGATDPVGACGSECISEPKCRYFWVYSKSSKKGLCCLKTGLAPGNISKPKCTECGGQFYSMDGSLVPNNASLGFDTWTPPALTMRGTAQHQLYSQITWRFYDVFLGIVMTYDAEDPAGHVHCMLSWSADSEKWQWVDSQGGLEALKEFIPAGGDSEFDSHVCFAAHLPLRMADGSSRLYYMGGDGPHSGERKSALGLATMDPDRFAGVTTLGAKDLSNVFTPNITSVVSGRAVNVTGSHMTVTVDVDQGGSISIGIAGGPSDLTRSVAIRTSGTDVRVEFPGGVTLDPVVGESYPLQLFLDRATLYTVGFSD